MKLNIQFWLKFSLLNLCLVAALGVLMRYKIGFEFPFFNQKNILHSHSHFAFSGWAYVEISPESRLSPDENFFLLYHHPYSFEADSWLRDHKK
ncbi:MAG TPA: hypothetical protein PLH20_07300, partial [Flavobacterium sp.]|nr:hypothetical protein [Flavobacterium sp.]